jgi:hypothetical protein
LPRRGEVERHIRPEVTSPEHERIREPRQVNKILEAASAFFAWELDPRLPKP